MRFTQKTPERWTGTRNCSVSLFPTGRSFPTFTAYHHTARRASIWLRPKRSLWEDWIPPYLRLIWPYVLCWSAGITYLGVRGSRAQQATRNRGALFQQKIEQPTPTTRTCHALVIPLYSSRARVQLQMVREVTPANQVQALAEVRRVRVLDLRVQRAVLRMVLRPVTLRVRAQARRRYGGRT